MCFHALAAGGAVDLTFERFGINGARLRWFLTGTSSLSLLNDARKIGVANQDAKAGSAKKSATFFDQASLQRLVARWTTTVQGYSGRENSILRNLGQLDQ
jgi:hypothetical protein